MPDSGRHRILKTETPTGCSSLSDTSKSSYPDPGIPASPHGSVARADRCSGPLLWSSASIDAVDVQDVLGGPPADGPGSARPSQHGCPDLHDPQHVGPHFPRRPVREAWAGPLRNRKPQFSFTFCTLSTTKRLTQKNPRPVGHNYHEQIWDPSIEFVQPSFRALGWYRVTVWLACRPVPTRRCQVDLTRG
jgi:hypothetical protein